VVTAYVLASGGLVLLGGRAADLAGRRRIFLADFGLAVGPGDDEPSRKHSPMSSAMGR